MEGTALGIEGSSVNGLGAERGGATRVDGIGEGAVDGPREGPIFTGPICDGLSEGDKKADGSVDNLLGISVGIVLVDGGDDGVADGSPKGTTRTGPAFDGLPDGCPVKDGCSTVSEGMSVGALLLDGGCEGNVDGLKEGLALETEISSFDGLKEGTISTDGSNVTLEGLPEGALLTDGASDSTIAKEGLIVEAIDGTKDGDAVAFTDGALDTDGRDDLVGTTDGIVEGAFDGAPDGLAEGGAVKVELKMNTLVVRTTSTPMELSAAIVTVFVFVTSLFVKFLSP